MELKPGYKQTEAGVIPDDWDAKTIGESFEICNHLRFPISEKVRGKMMGPYPYFGPTSIQGYINEYRIDGEHALIGEDGDHFLKWRDMPMTLLVSGKFNVNNHAHVIKGSKNLTAWFYYFFSHKDITQYLTRQGAGRYKLTKKALTDIPCALPPLHEQRAIAAALRDVDALIAALDRLIAKKRDIKQAAMQELLTGKRRLPGFEHEKGYKHTEIGVIPKDWNVKPLKSISSMNGRIGWQGLKQEEFTFNESDPFLITGMNFKDGQIKWNEVYHISEERYEEAKPIQLRTGDILMTKDGTIGKLLFVEEIPLPRKASLNSHLLVFRPLNGAYHPAFLYYELSSQNFSNFVELNKSGSTFFGITQGAIGNYLAYLPSIEEQIAIAAVLSDLDAEILALETRREKTRTLKQGMMQELLTGRIRLV